MDRFSEGYVIHLGQLMMSEALIISLPLLGVGLIVGVLISIFQAATQINEQTLTIVPKLLLVGVTLMLLMPWLITEMSELTLELINELPSVAR
jgi:flagellar biosynthetic protein FliQ